MSLFVAIVRIQGMISVNVGKRQFNNNPKNSVREVILSRFWHEHRNLQIFSI